MKALGSHLKAERVNRGLTQNAMAEFLGVTRSAYSLYESGLREPNLPTLKRISGILGISLDNLLEESEIDVRKEIQRQIKEISNSMDLSASEKKQKITELQNIHFSIGKDLHQNEEKQLKELRNTFVSLNQNGKELMLNFGDMLFKDEKYRDEMVHPSKVNKDTPQE